MFAELGALSGIMDRSAKKRQKADAGNPFAGKTHELSDKALQSYLERGADAGSKEFLADPLLGKSYEAGQEQLSAIGKDLGNIRGEERDLATRGYSMQPEDWEAYGQVSGNIARESGLQEASLAQALASRGLSNSNMAGRAFAGSQGNKFEQLRQSQRQIAQDRMKTNMERLGQTRQFMNQLMGQQSGALGRQQQFGLQGSQAKDQFAESKANMGQKNLALMMNQANENLDQQRAVAPGSFLEAAGGGAIQGAMTGAQIGASILGGGGGGGSNLASLFGPKPTPTRYSGGSGRAMPTGTT